jgi:hypothetical protein
MNDLCMSIPARKGFFLHCFAGRMQLRTFEMDGTLSMAEFTLVGSHKGS